MIARRSSGRRRYGGISPAVTWLLRAFAPGCPTMLRSWASKPVDGGGERLTIVYDLPDGKARLRAFELIKSAASLKTVAIGAHAIRDIEPRVTETPDLLTVDVLLVRK